MSRVTIESLYSDFTVPRTEAREYGMNYEKYAKLAETEIVPRRIVEMIIEKCKDHTSGPKPSDFLVGVSNEAGLIATYAESLLKEFEEDKDDEDVTCNTQVDEKSSEKEPIFGQAFDPD